MNNSKNLLLLIFSLALVFNLAATNFSDINLSSDNRLLFKAEFEGQQALFISRLPDMSLRQLTAFPEKVHLVDNGSTILAINRFGAVRISTSGGLPSPLPGYPSFSEGNLPMKGRLQDIAASGDGRWYLYVQPTSPGFGSLLLVDIPGGTRRVISERVELPGASFPAKWSPDSRLFVYEKGGRLFYVPILSDMSVLVDERFRMLGSGTMASVLWGHHGDFYYLSGNIIYRILSPELFTRTIYGDFLSIGNVAAVLPMDFDPRFDRYWIAPDSGSVLINKGGGKGIFFFMLGENRNNSATSAPAVLPHIVIPFGAENFNVLWPSRGPITISYSLQDQTSVLRFEINSDNIYTLTHRTGPSSPNGVLSPDGTRAVFWGENGLELWDYTNWRQLQRLSPSPVFFCAWVNNNQFITGNSRFIEEISVASFSYPRRRISLSTADESGFEENTRGLSRILARVGADWFASDGTSAWTTVNNVELRQISFSSEHFRIFLEQQAVGHFQNNILIRNINSVGTVSLFSRHTANNVFTPARQMQIALCFDLYDDDTGLQQVLAALRRHGIRATFFMNGEFIRRNPLAARAVAEAGHETASLFYAPIDLSDTRFLVTGDFIARGLARNEDEFNRATGKELSPLWHPPFYRSTDAINTAAAAIGYTTAVRNIDPGDWISREDALRLNLRQVSPAEMIEQIINSKRTGAVIPVRIGLLPGGRDEYLFQRIDVLLDALIRFGCEIVPVSSVISR